MFRANSAERDGGAFYLAASEAALDACVLDANKAENGAGALLDDGSALALRDSSLAGNAAGLGTTRGAGGAVFVLGGSRLLANSSTFSANTATDYGGAVAIGLWAGAVDEVDRTLLNMLRCAFAANGARAAAARSIS